jgi:rod shape-determining protein MreC
MAYAASTGQLTALPQNIMGALAVPFQKATSSIGNKIDAWTDRSLNIDSIIEENEQLKRELAIMRSKQIEYDRIALENKEYKKLLNITDDIQQFETLGASVIGRDGMDKFYSFTIDKGTRHGVAVNDVVISADGLIGMVVETGANFAKVSTILSPAVNVGCIAGSERDVGISSGNYNLSQGEVCVMNYLPKDTKVKAGDIVSTTGYGTVFPKDLIIGTVESVDIQDSGNSKYATVKPAADIENAKIVFVITDFTE